MDFIKIRYNRDEYFMLPRCEMIDFIVDIFDEIGGYGNDCGGYSLKPMAYQLIRPFFERESISFKGWKIWEIPLVGASDGYTVGLVVNLLNKRLRKSVVINIDLKGEVYCYEVYRAPYCFAEEDTVYLTSLKEALAHPFSSY